MLHTYSPIAHRSLLAPALGLLGFCGALLAAPAAHAQASTKYEAEAPTNTLAGTGIVVESTITGYTGTGYVNLNGNSGLSITFPVTVTTAGDYNLVVRYESQFGTVQPGYAKVGAYKVNGGVENKIYFNGTAPGIAGANFKSTSNLRVTLNAGANTIAITDNGFGYFGVDYITLTAAAATTGLAPSAAGRVEAESGQLVGLQSLIRDDDTGAHSGTSYVTSFNDGSPAASTLTLPVTIATAGLYQIAVGARNVTNENSKQFDLAVTTGTSVGGKLTTSLGPADAAFKPYVVGKYNLAAGTSTITITSQTGYLDVDYVDITTTTGVATAARASAEAQKALSAYPNPTNGQALNVSLELDKAQDATFDLVNSLGQRVSTATRSLRAGSNQLQLPTAGVAGGLYQLVVRRGDQPTLVQRVVVN